MKDRSERNDIRADVGELHASYLRKWVRLGFRTEGPKGRLVRVRVGDLVRRSQWLAAAAVAALVAAALGGIGLLGFLVGVVILFAISWLTVPAVSSGGYEARGYVIASGEQDQDGSPIGCSAPTLDGLAAELATQIGEVVPALTVAVWIGEATAEADGRRPLLVERPVGREGQTIALARFTVEWD